MMLHSELHLDHDAMHASCEACALSAFIVPSTSPILQAIAFPIVETLLLVSVFFVPFMVMRVRAARSPPLPLLRRI